MNDWHRTLRGPCTDVQGLHHFFSLKRRGAFIRQRLASKDGERVKSAIAAKKFVQRQPAAFITLAIQDEACSSKRWPCTSPSGRLCRWHAVPSSPRVRLFWTFGGCDLRRSQWTACPCMKMSR